MENMNKNEPMIEIELDQEAIATPVATPIAHTVKRGRGRPAKVEKQIFIDVWNNAENLNDVAQSLGMPASSVSVKASNLRKTGCELKMFRRGRKRKTAM